MDASSSSKPPQSARGTIIWPEQPSIKQYFSLPSSITHYIAKNPSSANVYKKLAQSCKYYFEKNPIIVVQDIYEDAIASIDNIRGIRESRDVKFNNYISKFWVTNSVDFSFDISPNFTTMLRPNLYRCDASYVTLIDITFKFEVFEMFASSAKDVEIRNVKMIHEDGSVVKLETILGALPKLESFGLSILMNPSVVTGETFKNILKLENLQHLKDVRIEWMSLNCNTEDLAAFMMKYKNTKFLIEFDDDGITPENKTHFDALVDAVIQSEIPNRGIFYDGQDIGKLKIMNERYRRNDY